MVGMGGTDPTPGDTHAPPSHSFCEQPARKPPTSKARPQNSAPARLTRTLDRDNRFDPALVALVVEVVGVVPLVHSDRLRLDAASADCVEQGGEVGLLPPRRLDLTRERKPRLGANGKVELVSVVPATLARVDSGAVPPRCVRKTGQAPPLPVRLSARRCSISSAFSLAAHSSGV